MYKSKTILCIIPARSGSQSIKNKNLQKVGSSTLVARSVSHAKKCKYIDEIVVSTDGKEIKSEAIRGGAIVIDRPPEISGPTNSTEEALLHCISLKKGYDYIVLLQPTSPFRFDSLINRCIKRIVNENGDSLLAAWEFHNFCFYKMFKDGIWISTYDYHNRPMHQQLSINEFLMFDCGNLYITKTSHLLEKKCRLGGKIIIEPISFLESIQIDSIKELIVCQQIANGEIN